MIEIRPITPRPYQVRGVAARPRWRSPDGLECGQEYAAYLVTRRAS